MTRAGRDSNAERMEASVLTGVSLWPCEETDAGAGASILHSVALLHATGGWIIVRLFFPFV